jgi:hypothetical protein
MRQHGLILENVDGSDLLQTKFVMRGVPHTLALGTSIDFSDGFVTVPHLGWSGDGGAGDGSLRLFAVGAVFQHFPKTLDREDANQDPVSPDFRFPDDSELDAMEAFQLSLGRAEDLDLLAMDFIDPVPPLPSVTAGLQAFLDVGCNNCHFDAGANVDPASLIGSGNANFDTNVEEFFQNGQAHHGKRPFDGGFGPRPAVAGTCPATGCGNGAFNPPSLVEAADTSPFFHNNSVTTIEEAVAFYLSDDFKDSPTGFMVQNFNADQVADMAAFLRVLNALENIRSAEEPSEGASKSHEPQEASALARAAGFEIEDAIEVLTIEGVELYPGAVTCLLDAGVFLEEAGETEHYPTRKQLIGEAIGELGCARDEMIL